MDSNVIVKMSNIHKSFPGVKALNGVDLEIRKGEVHGLVGENGAGKSTLIKILMGVHNTFEKGDILINGKKVQINSPIQAQEHGLAAVYQDLNLAMSLSVGENFFLGEMPLKKNGLVDWNKVNRVSREVLESLDMDIDPTQRVSKLSAAEQAIVLIAKTLYQDSKLVIFDEPTALVTEEETKLIFNSIEKMKERGVGIIYISHRLEEIFTICDTVTVFKDGERVDTLPVKDTSQESIVSMMIGRAFDNVHYINSRPIGEKYLEVRNLSRGKAFKDISFSVARGESMGFYGLVGSGMADVARSIFGGEPYDTGEILINGSKVNIKSPIDGIKHKMSYLPEDRKNEGLALRLDVVTNINLSSYERISRGGFIDQTKERRNAEKYVDALNIKTPSIRQKVINLSGGNQQKVVFAKWLCGNSEIFIFVEPTVGVDIGAKFEIYKLIEEILKDGKSVILVSSYLPELMGLTDKAMVFYEGEDMGTLTKDEYDEERFLHLASGVNVNNSSKSRSNDV